MCGIRAIRRHALGSSGGGKAEVGKMAKLKTLLIRMAGPFKNMEMMISRLHVQAQM